MFHFDIAAFVESLDIMWKGVLGIFIVTAAIVASIAILNAASKKRTNKK